jgi:hypothetical protein
VLGEEHLERKAPDRIAVDLHHRIGRPGAPGGLTARALLENLAPIAFGGSRLPTPAPTLALAISTISIAKALYNREPVAAYLSDLFAGVMADAQQAVSSLFTLASQYGLEGPVNVALALVAEIYGTSQASLDGLPRAFRALGRAQLLDMIFRPADARTRQPKRRHIVWELSARQPQRYAKGLLSIAYSEVMRRMFERGEARAKHID